MTAFIVAETTIVIELPLENPSVKKVSIHLEQVYMRQRANDSFLLVNGIKKCYQ